jgi:hypothetical protein
MALEGKKKLFVLEVGGRVHRLSAADLSILQEKGWISQPGQVVFFYNNMLQHAGVEAEDPPASGHDFRGIPHEIAPASVDGQAQLCTYTSASAWLSRTSHTSLVESCQRHIQKNQKKEFGFESQAQAAQAENNNNLNNEGEEEEEPQTKRQRE